METPMDEPMKGSGNSASGMAMKAPGRKERNVSFEDTVSGKNEPKTLNDDTGRSERNTPCDDASRNEPKSTGDEDASSGNENSHTVVVHAEQLATLIDSLNRANQRSNWAKKKLEETILMLSHSHDREKGHLAKLDRMKEQLEETMLTLSHSHDREKGHLAELDEMIELLAEQQKRQRLVPVKFLSLGVGSGVAATFIVMIKPDLYQQGLSLSRTLAGYLGLLLFKLVKWSLAVLLAISVLVCALVYGTRFVRFIRLLSHKISKGENDVHLCARATPELGSAAKMYRLKDLFRKKYPQGTPPSKMLNKQNREGQTPAHLAVETRNVVFICFLSEMDGIDFSIKDHQGRNVLDLARLKRAELIQKHQETKATSEKARFWQTVHVEAMETILSRVQGRPEFEHERTESTSKPSVSDSSHE